jgi:hypothetical protein
MKIQSHSRIGWTAFVVAGFFGCGVTPAPTEEQTAALFHGGPPPFVRECEGLLKDCARLHRPRLRDACVWEVLRGECGHLSHGHDAGPVGIDGPASAPEAGIRDAGFDVGRDSGICDPSTMSCNRDGGRDQGAQGPDAGASDGAAVVHPDSGARDSGAIRDAARDSAHNIDGALDSGANGDASADAQVNACPSSTGPAPLPAFFNCSSRGQNCGGCLEALTGGDTVCASCSTDQSRSACQALLGCMATQQFACASGESKIGMRCFCSDDSCSAGANGPCVSEAEAVAGTQDSAEVVKQLQDPSTTVNRIALEAVKFANAGGCEMFCSCLE